MSAPNIPYRYAPPRQRLNPWMIRLPLLAGTGLILFILLTVMLLAGYQFLHRDEIYPGVSTVYDINLAGMNREEAIAALSIRAEGVEAATYTFRYGGQQWQYTAGDLGVHLDIEATVNEAYNAGRGGNFWDSLYSQFDIRSNGYTVAPIITYNQTEAERILRDIAGSYIDRPVVDAQLTFSQGEAVASPSQIGTSVDIPATLGILRGQILALSQHSEINLVIRQTAPTVVDAVAAADQINLALSDPVEFYILEGDQGPWQMTPEQLREMLVIEQVAQPDGTTIYQVSMNLDPPRAFLDSIAPDLTADPVNARFVFDDETHQLEVIEHSVNGRALDVESTIAEFETALFATNPAERRVRLIFQEMIPTVNDQATASQLGITELVVQRTTYYYGSTSARRTNIEVAAANFHGLVIPPGEEFSFNQWLGDVSVESGYEQGLIIVGNQTITGVGGGVCQVASTAFQTAFYGGYPILERVEHAYRVGYYEEGEGPGMDATVYSPIVNFRFLNDTPYHLLIEVYVNNANSTVTWKFYSTSLGRRVVKEGPIIRNQTSPPPAIYRANSSLNLGQIQQVDYAVGGADVYIYRTVYEGDRVIIDHEEYHSHYMPWASQFEVAPGDSRINN